MGTADSYVSVFVFLSLLVLSDVGIIVISNASSEEQTQQQNNDEAAAFQRRFHISVDDADSRSLNNSNQVRKNVCFDVLGR